MAALSLRKLWTGEACLSPLPLTLWRTAFPWVKRLGVLEKKLPFLSFDAEAAAAPNGDGISGSF